MNCRVGKAQRAHHSCGALTVGDGACPRARDDGSTPTPLSSPGLTGRSSTPRPIDQSLGPLEYWITRFRG
jgi:hypothetical protein